MRRIHDNAPRTWHVFARGARRLALYYGEEDYRHFMMFLKEALILSGCALFGYVLMGNHYHLMLRGTQAQLTRCMQRLNWRFALFHNDTHRMGGHVFDGPYQAYPQRSLMWALWRLAYIFLNPVSAGLVGKAEDYAWSGYRSFMGMEGSPLEVDFMPDLAAADRRGLPGAREHFRVILAEQQSRGKKRDGATPTAAEIQADQFDWICRQAEERVQRVPDIDRESLALLWGRDCGVPTRVMAKALGIPSGQAVCIRLRRVEELLATDDSLVRRLTL